MANQFLILISTTDCWLCQLTIDVRTIAYVETITDVRYDIAQNI